MFTNSYGDLTNIGCLFTSVFIEILLPLFQYVDFWKFDNLFIRIDILERLFVLIINSTSKENTEVKLIPEMLNLLGCSKNNFKELLKKMHYKIFEKNDETYFKYSPTKKFKKVTSKKVSNENPFKILKNLNLN